MRESVAEILQKVESAKTKQEKINILQQNQTYVFPLLHYALHPKATWDLPETDPSYKPLDKAMDAQGRLVSEYRRFYIFIKGNSDVAQIKKEQLFIDLLETVDPDDAKLLLFVKNKTLPYKSIDVKLVKAAFPQQTKDW